MGRAPEARDALAPAYSSCREFAYSSFEQLMKLKFPYFRFLKHPSGQA